MPKNQYDNLFQKRSRSGCWTCRKRHQKCDEQKPTCLNCRLRGADCGGYGIVLTDFTALSNRKGQMVSKIKRNQNRPDGQDVEITTRPSPPRSLLALESGEDDDTSESPFQPTDDSALLDLEMRLDENIDWILSEEHGAQWNHVTSPTATETAGDWFSESGHSVDVSTLDPSLLCMHDIGLPPTPQDPFDQYLFTYYMETLALRLYPIKTDQNPYRKIYGALATESEPLLKSIMLASA
ncbi:hypothetical protein N7456_009460 [Penicillium angulare]|uniref:Zn(2)-C6 fungal-type domain-containing protein n=1 Tax=Penicillium angulare TaxID=116970 RepID=A0A9W9K5A2_9EURO|nr:hypothetical protein N7456_009460 [Penicillium angulare]